MDILFGWCDGQDKALGSPQIGLRMPERSYIYTFECLRWMHETANAATNEPVRWLRRCCYIFFPQSSSGNFILLASVPKEEPGQKPMIERGVAGPDTRDAVRAERKIEPVV